MAIAEQLVADNRFITMTRNRDVRRVFWLWLLLTLVFGVFGAFVPARLMGPPASETMHAVESTMTIFSVLSAPVMAVVVAIAVYSLIAWRTTKWNENPAADGPPIRNNNPASVTWVIISALLCVFLLIWGLAEMQSTASAASAANPLVVNVTGQQWVWTYSYPGEGNVESQDLVLPLNRPVVFHVTSKDVIHSFWIVEMGIKIDANPGYTTKTSVTPNKLGTFTVRCAELCGLYHSEMENQVQVVSDTDFGTWIGQHGGHL